jgi:hypothetical protein
MTTAGQEIDFDVDRDAGLAFDENIWFGDDHVWQGRFRSFPIQQDDHLLTVRH